MRKWNPSSVHAIARHWRSVALACAFGVASAANAAGYLQHNLVSDGAVAADHVDPNLVNPWGLAFNPAAADWVANNGTGTSTLYDGSGNILSLVVGIPAAGGTPGGVPTGTVYNGTGGFAVSAGGVSGSGLFLFAGEDGTLSGWAPNVNSATAILAVDNSAAGNVYKGLALGTDGTSPRLYATDFHNNKVDVYDSNFHAVTTAGAFVDPNLPAHYAPFGIQVIGTRVYVTYARQDKDAHDNVNGRGLGLVDVYTTAGGFVRRLASHGWLNAPWGVAMAPAGFGKFSHRLLVGNFGDGKINAYDAKSGQWVGQLMDASGTAIANPGLWGIAFGNGLMNQPTTTLFFAAGINDEANGLYGRIDAQ